MAIFILFIIGCMSGFILFSKNPVKDDGKRFSGDAKVSVIIPARNEAENLPFILGSLKNQTYTPYEIIVVDDQSSDDTKGVARSLGATVVESRELPVGWTGKTWAVWNGFLNSTGDILVFIDADVRLAPKALDSILKTREKEGGAISVVPFHHTEKFYERFAMISNILGVFAFTSPIERRNREKGLYGACIAVDRNDYLKVHGHNSVKSLLLDDMNLGRKFSDAGVNVTNFIGYDMVSFRMYPQGMMSEIQGFGKGAVLSTATLKPWSVVMIALWMLGLVAAEFVTPVLLFINPPMAIPFAIGYAVYTIQMIYLLRYIGYFGIIMPVLHFLSTIFFFVVLLYSVYKTKFKGSITWKGREIDVRERRNK